jgi:hypothetical protein
MHLLSGVSPVVPLALLSAGLYLWFWHSLHGLALFGLDQPLLPRESDLLVQARHRSKIPKEILRMFSRESADELKKGATPLASEAMLLMPCVFLLMLGIVRVLSRHWPVRSLGTYYYADFFLFCVMACCTLMLVEVWQLLRTWVRLRVLLMFLDRLPLRRTLAALRGFTWGTVWGMSGNVLDVRYKLLSRQLESLGHARASLSELNGFSDCVRSLDHTRRVGLAFAKWYADGYRCPDIGNLRPLRGFQHSVAKTAAVLWVHILLPEWAEEKESLILEQSTSENKEAQQKAPPLCQKEYVRDVEEFVCLPYLGFVQNILGRMRSMALNILWLFVATALAVSSYPFDPRQGLSGTMLALFLVLGAVISYVYAQMHRDTTLSHVTNTTPGELGGEFWLKLVEFAAVPLFGLLTTMFPQITDFFFSWVQPGLESFK